MIIYKDLFTGDELFSDSYKMKKVMNGFFFEVEGKMITERDGIDDSLIGGNASAEGGAEALEEESTTAVNIVIANKLREIPKMSKKDYQIHIKAYVGKVVKKLEETNPGRVDEFKAAAKDAVKEVLANYKDFEFFVGEKDEEEKGMIALLNFREDGITPYMLFVCDGLIEEKV